MTTPNQYMAQSDQDMAQPNPDMALPNPWHVDSVQAFLYLKCPECTFDTKKGDTFRDHALENHPLSFALFGKICKEEDIRSNIFSDGYSLEGMAIKEEFPDFNLNATNVQMFEKCYFFEKKNLVKKTCVIASLDS